MTANVAISSALFLSISENELGPGCEGFGPVREAFLDKVCALQVNNDDITNMTLAGADFRRVVDWLDYSLSFRVSRDYRNRVVNIVDSLGYRALAGVLRGDVCMSPAKLYIEDGKIKLAGKACKAGWLAMRKNIPGVKLPRHRGDKNPYEASVVHASKFIDLAVQHWPFIDESVNLEALKEEAAELARQHATSGGDQLVASEACTPSRMVAYVTNLNSDFFSVRTGWSNSPEFQNMIAIFKSLPKADRAYDAMSRTWKFKTCHRDSVMTAVSRLYVLQVH
jgi:hypothetical protein